MKDYELEQVLTSSALRAYEGACERHPDVFGGSFCGHDMCFGGRITVTDNRTDKSYPAPEGETDELFKNRIERSIAAGRNLFFEEWQPETYRRDVLY